MTKLVSILMPVHNRASFVARAVRSVLEQTHANIELIITDDASTDGTHNVLDGLVDPRIRRARFDKVRGQAAALNHCLDLATGDYIGFLAADDMFFPDKIERQLAALAANPGWGGCFTDVYVIDENGDPFRDTSHPAMHLFTQPNRPRAEWLKHFFYVGNALSASSALLPRHVVDAVGRFDERLQQWPRIDYWMRVLTRYDIGVMPEHLTQYRLRTGRKNITYNDRYARRRLMFEHIEILKKFARAVDYDMVAAMFPREAAKVTGNPSPVIAEYILAQAAIQFGKHKGAKLFAQTARIFGLQTLFALMADPRIAAQLENQCGFTPRALSRLIGSYDVYARDRGLAAFIRQFLRWLGFYTN